MDDAWFPGVRRPTHQQHIEATRLVAKAVSAKKMQRRMSNSALFEAVDRSGRPGDIAGGGGANFHEDQAAAIQRNPVKFAAGAGLVAFQNAEALASQEMLGGAFGAVAEPAPPPGPTT